MAGTTRGKKRFGEKAVTRLGSVKDETENLKVFSGNELLVKRYQFQVKN